MQRRFPLTPFDAGSDVSHLNIAEKNMFEWPQITKPHRRRVLRSQTLC